MNTYKLAVFTIVISFILAFNVMASITMTTYETMSETNAITNNSQLASYQEPETSFWHKLTHH